MKNIEKKIRAYISTLYHYISSNFYQSRIKSAIQIPIIINNYNRVTTLKRLIESLETRGYSNIYIIDNNSDYPPLLEYYETCKYKVFHLKKNLGFKALWKSKLNKELCKDYFIYTDSDVVLHEDCPCDVIDVLWKKLKAKKFTRKIGLSICINDIPDSFAHKQKVLNMESAYYSQYDKEENLYRAPVDTTFALYKPKMSLSRSRFVEVYRIGYPYQLKHLPWYVDSSNLDEEETYYISSCKHATTWSSKAKKDNPTK